MLLLPTFYIFLPNVVQYLHPRSNRTCRLIVPLRFSPIGLSRPADSQSGPRGRPLSGPLHISSLYPSLPFPGSPPPPLGGPGPIGFAVIFRFFHQHLQRPFSVFLHAVAFPILFRPILFALLHIKKAVEKNSFQKI